MKKQIINILAKTPLALRVVSLYAVIGLVAGVYVSIPSSVEATNSSTSPVTVYEQPHSEPVAPFVPENVSDLPRKIELPRIGLVRDVIDGYYDTSTQEWTLTDDKVQYASMTSKINSISGQTVLYGHNTSAVLEPVRYVEEGDELLVTTENGHVLVYEYTHDRFVYPTDASVMYESPETPKVVLMTCEGWFSTTRRLLYFDFKEIR